MNSLKLSRDIKGIIYKYIIISKYNVKRNHGLVVYNIELGNYNKPKTKRPFDYCYCPICNLPSHHFKDHYYILDSYFEDIGKNTKYIFNKDYPCIHCFRICINKFVLLKQIKLI
jgi:hypothetical protein